MDEHAISIDAEIEVSNFYPDFVLLEKENQAGK